MKLSHKSQTLWDMISPAVAACGVELWGVEFIQQGRKSMLRVFIDKSTDSSVADVQDVMADLTDDALLDGEDLTGKGVSAEDCVNVSHQVSGVLDVNDPIAGEYTLEVSSPGWDRPFFNIEQMLAYVGQTVALRLISPVENRRKATGILSAIDGQTLTVQVDNLVLVIDRDNVDKANLVYQAV